MKILDKILLAHDLTDAAKEVEEAGEQIAKVFNSQLIPIHILPNDLLNQKVKQLLQNTAKEKLQAVADRLNKRGLSVEPPIVDYGAAWEVIASNAAETNANLILVGSGVPHPRNHFQLGTTTERIIQKSEKPVMVVKQGAGLKINSILCPVDFSDASKRALKNAIFIARRFEAQLVILSVCETQSSWLGSTSELAAENEEKYVRNQKAFDEFLNSFQLIDVDWTKQHKQGKPADQILKSVEEEKVDLLIMGTNGRSGLNRLMMGSVTEKVIREVPCSFMTLKSEDAINLHLESDIQDFEKLAATAAQLAKDGFYEQAIEYYKDCLTINNMNVPVYLALADIHEKLSEPEKAELYRKSAQEIKERIWYTKIEDEARKLRGSM